MQIKTTRNPGSFRDPASRVYETVTQEGYIRSIIRGVDGESQHNFLTVSQLDFYRKLERDGDIVRTLEISSETDRPEVATILDDGWTGVLEHEKVEVISYPYEWSFSMLQDAAILHLRILQQCLKNGWTLKDATPYNVQWRGGKPVFIDIPSFVPRQKGEHWFAYRQFCMMFFTPLAINAHLGIDHVPLVRSRLDGIPPVDAVRYFQGLNRFKKGVLSHIIFSAIVERRIVRKERNKTPATKRNALKQSDTIVFALVDSMLRLITGLRQSPGQTAWSDYQENHSYSEVEHKEKTQFVQKHVVGKGFNLMWDLGCNAGQFSRVCSEHINYVVAIDGDYMAVERLYQNEKTTNNRKILPLVMDLNNISPDQGWMSGERAAFDKRSSPDLVLFLALVHHLRLSANIPLHSILQWLRSLNALIVFEFVGRDDEMVTKLLTNKKEQYEDYTQENFEYFATQLFDISDRQILKSGKREIFLLSPI